MAEKSPKQWWAAVRRWSAVGAAVGLATALGVSVYDPAPHGPLEVLGHIASLTLMGGAMGLILWASAYRYHFPAVWGWAATGLTCGLIVLLGGSGIAIGCALGACGER